MARNLKTDYKNSQYLGEKKYLTINNPDGTVSFEDKTEYVDVGDYLNANDINQMNDYINKSTTVSLGTQIQEKVTLEPVTAETQYEVPDYRVQFRTENGDLVSIRVDPQNILISKDNGANVITLNNALTLFYTIINRGALFSVKSQSLFTELNKYFNITE